VEWWRDEHLEPMDETRHIVARMCPPNLPPGESVVSVASRAKRFTTIVDKLLREPVKLADMADVGGVRAVVDSRAGVDLRLVADQIASAELGETEEGLQARLAAAQRVADPFIRSPRLRSLRS
jgi:hypothetical protein